MGCKGENFAIFLTVRSGFQIDPNLPNETYRKLADALRLDGRSGNPFRTSDFFREFNAHIPDHATPENRAKPQDTAP